MEKETNVKKSPDLIAIATTTILFSWQFKRSLLLVDTRKRQSAANT